MRYKKLVSITCAVASMVTLSSRANDINLQTAQQTARSFVQTHVCQHGTLNVAAPTVDLQLIHAEQSTVKEDAAAFYVFNIGANEGFVIVAGEDRAVQVLGYSDTGSLDWDNLPSNMRGWLDCYKEQIEWLQANPCSEAEENSTEVLASASSSRAIEPLVPTTWGQRAPYNNQCPTYQGDTCLVGCAATAMAQVMTYWNYPNELPALSSYTTSSCRISVPALSATTIDWSQILNSYCHWDANEGALVQDDYTAAQEAEVAKLNRYCGQATAMNYGTSTSSSYVSNERSGMVKFGYNNATMRTRSNSYGTTYYYTTSEWTSMLDAELDANRPVLYAASSETSGHAFIVDGRDASGNYHFNWGWYGHGDGYFAIDAMNVVHRTGTTYKFNYYHRMIIDVVPPEYLVVRANDIDVTSEEIFSPTATVTASDVKLLSSDDNASLVFVLVDQQGNEECRSQAIVTNNSTLSQGNVTGVITVPQGLERGKYELELCVYTDNANQLTDARCPVATARVVGNLVSYDGNFDISDVSELIDVVLTGECENVSITDVSDLIDAVLDESLK